VVDLDGNDELDITTAEQLGKLVHELHGDGIQLCFAHVHAPARDMLQATGVLDDLGADHLFPNIDAAVNWTNRHGNG
jgi:MFS superfamily sulfate permease-like transporter